MRIAWIGLLLFFSANSLVVFSQDCSVEIDALKGTYAGECKKGKAHGLGKAIGTDTYEGSFKNGMPDGKGLYTWSNGNTYDGQYVKGMREGKGAFNYKRLNNSDSIINGFWKRDVFIGKNEKPYKAYYQSKMITELEIEHKKDGFMQVTVFVSNTSSGAISGSGNEELPKLKVDDVHLIKGNFAGRLNHNMNHAKKSESIITNLEFPVRLKLTIGSEEIDVEFLEPGSYVVNVRINQ
jgi:hypothetical protein